jgi:hypothetical protein
VGDAETRDPVLKTTGNGIADKYGINNFKY